MSPAVKWDAAAYETVATPQLSWGLKLIGSRAWRGDEVVLDAGCGTGRLAEEILHKVPRGRVIAVDLDPSMVAKAKQTLSKHGARVTVTQADLQELGSIEPVDVIFSNAVLHWVPDHDRVFEAFVHHLKPGGELLVQCGGEGNLDRVRQAGADLQKDSRFAPHFKSWKSPWHYEDDASTEERLLIAGFVHPKVSLQKSPTTFPDRSSYEKFLRAVVLNPYLQALPDEKLRDAFVNALITQMETSGAGYVLDYVRLNIRAQRSPHA